MSLPQDCTKERKSWYILHLGLANVLLKICTKDMIELQKKGAILLWGKLTPFELFLKNEEEAHNKDKHGGRGQANVLLIS